MAPNYIENNLPFVHYGHLPVLERTGFHQSSVCQKLIAANMPALYY